MNLQNKNLKVIFALVLTVVIMVFAFVIYSHLTSITITQIDDNISGNTASDHGSVLYTKTSDGILELKKYLNNGKIETISTITDISSVENIRWSPDSKSVAFSATKVMDSAMLSNNEPENMFFVVRDKKVIYEDKNVPNNYIFTDNSALLLFYTPVGLGEFSPYFVNAKLTDTGLETHESTKHDAPGIIIGGINGQQVVFIDYDPDTDWSADTIWKYNIESEKIEILSKVKSIKDILVLDNDKYLITKLEDETIAVYILSDGISTKVSSSSILDRYTYLKDRVFGFTENNYKYDYTSLESETNNTNNIDTLGYLGNKKDYIKDKVLGNCRFLNKVTDKSISFVCDNKLFLLSRAINF